MGADLDLDGAGAGVRCGRTSGPASRDCLPGRIEAVMLAFDARGEQETVRSVSGIAWPLRGSVTDASMPSRLGMSASSALSFPVAQASGLDGPQAECNNDTGLPSLRVMFAW